MGECVKNVDCYRIRTSGVGTPSLHLYQTARWFCGLKLREAGKGLSVLFMREGSLEGKNIYPEPCRETASKFTHWAFLGETRHERKRHGVRRCKFWSCLDCLPLITVKTLKYFFWPSVCTSYDWRQQSPLIGSVFYSLNPHPLLWVSSGSMNAKAPSERKSALGTLASCYGYVVFGKGSIS